MVTVPIGHNCISVKYCVWEIRVRFGVRFRVSVNSFMGSFSVLLRAQHYSMLLLTVRYRNNTEYLSEAENNINEYYYAIFQHTSHPLTIFPSTGRSAQ